MCFNYWVSLFSSVHFRGLRGCDCMVVEFTTTCAIADYHHWHCEFEPCSWRVVFDTTLCDYNKVDGFLCVLWFPPLIKLKVTLNTINLPNKQFISSLKLIQKNYFNKKNLQLFVIFKLSCNLLSFGDVMFFCPVHHKCFYEQLLHFLWEFFKALHACLLLYEKFRNIIPD